MPIDYLPELLTMLLEKPVANAVLERVRQMIKEGATDEQIRRAFLEKVNSELAKRVQPADVRTIGG